MPLPWQRMRIRDNHCLNLSLQRWLIKDSELQTASATASLSWCSMLLGDWLPSKAGKIDK